jgi:hypothetical protein
MLKTAYLVVSAAMVARGAYEIVSDFPEGALGGFPTAIIGAIHLLNWRHGRAAAGIRRSAVLAGPAFLAVLFALGARVEWDALAVLFVLLFLAPSALALWAPAADPRPAAASVLGGSGVSAGASAAYLLATTGVVAAGVYLAADSLLQRGFFFEIGVMAACSFWLVALVNVLNWRYGAAMPAVRRSLPAINAAFAMILWRAGGWLGGATFGLEQVMFFWVPVLLALLSVVVVVDRVRPLVPSGPAAARSICLLLALGVTVGGAAPAAAQPSGGRQPERVAIILGLGGLQGGPAKDFEAAMRAAQFGDTSPNFFGSGERDYPRSTGGGAWFAEVRVPVAARFAAGLLAGRTGTGTTHGYRRDWLSLSLGYDTRLVAPVGSIELLPWLHVGGGPAFVRTTVARVGGSMGREVAQHQQTGAVGLVNVATPARRRLFLDLHAEYRKIGTITAGPYEVSSLDSHAIFPATTVRLDHWLLGGGLGIRF